MYIYLYTLYKYIYPLSFGFPSHLGHHRVLSGVLCAEQCTYTSYLFYISIIYICISPKWDEEDNFLMAGERHQFSKCMCFCVVLCLHISAHWRTFPGFLSLTSTWSFFSWEEAWPRTLAYFIYRTIKITIPSSKWGKLWAVNACVSN